MVEERNLSEHMLTAVEIIELANSLQVPIQDLLRPNSPHYKEHKDELLKMEPSALARIISSEPTLIKRPIIRIDGDYIVGLDEEKIFQLIDNKRS